MRRRQCEQGESDTLVARAWRSQRHSSAGVRAPARSHLQLAPHSRVVRSGPRWHAHAHDRENGTAPSSADSLPPAARATTRRSHEQASDTRHDRGGRSWDGHWVTLSLPSRRPRRRTTRLSPVSAITVPSSVVESRLSSPRARADWRRSASTLVPPPSRRVVSLLLALSASADGDVGGLL